MELFFYYDANNDCFDNFKTEQERNENLLEYINDLYIIDGVYDDDIIGDIQIGVVTHTLKYKPLQIKKEGEEWYYSPEVESAGVYEIKQIKQ